MPEKAKVTSIEAIESFRSSLIVYLEKAKRVLDEISAEVMRTRNWLQEDRREHWQRELRRRAKQLEEKQQELFSAELAKLREVTSAERMAVAHAKRALVETEARMDVVKRWNRDFDNRVEPLAKEVDKLRDVLISHMQKGAFYLNEITKALADYAGVKSPTEPTTRAPESGADSNTTPSNEVKTGNE